MTQPGMEPGPVDITEAERILPPDFKGIVKGQVFDPTREETPSMAGRFPGIITDQPLRGRFAIQKRLALSRTEFESPEQELASKVETLRSMPGFENGDIYIYPPLEPGDEPTMAYKMNRDDPDERPKLIDAPFGKGGFQEIAADIAEFVGGDLGAIFGEGVALKARTKALGRFAAKRTPVRLLADVWDNTPAGRMAAGAFGGEMAQSEFERVVGLTDLSRERQLRRAIGQAALAGFGGFVVDKLGKPIVNLSKGQGVIRQKPSQLGGPGGARAQQAMRELDLPPLPINLVASSPLVAKLGGQAGALTTSLREYVDFLELANAAHFSKFSQLPFKDPHFPSLDYLARVHRRESQRILERTMSFVRAKAKTDKQGKSVENLLTKTGQLKPKRPGAISPTEAGEKFKAALADYDTYAQTLVNRAYGKARQVEEPEFDLTRLKRIANKIQTGTRIGQKGEVVPTKILAPNGMPAGTIQLPGESVRSAVLDKDLAEVIGLVKNLDLEQPGAASATDQLNALAKRLHDAMLPPAAAGAYEHKKLPYAEARELFAAVRQTLDDVKNTNPEFVKLWKRARLIAKERFDTNESLLFITAVKNETPTALAERLTNLNDPKTADFWDLLNRTVRNMHGSEANKYLDMVQEYVVSDLLSRPADLSHRLATANTSVLKGVRHEGITRPGLLKPRHLAALERAAEDYDKLFDLGIQKTLRHQTKIGSIINRLTRNEHTATIDYLADLVKKNGGIDGPLHRMLSAGMVRDLFKRARVQERGRRVDFRKLSGELIELENSGAIQFLTTKDRRMLENTEIAQDYLRLRSDAGTSLQAAEAAAQVRGGSMQGLLTIAENVGISYAFRNPAWIKILTGGRAQQTDVGDIARLSGAIAAQATFDAESTGALLQEINNVILGLPGAALREVRDFVSPASEP